MSEDARFRKGFLLALVVAITATFVFVIRDFLMTIFVAARAERALIELFLSEYADGQYNGGKLDWIAPGTR